VRASRTLTFSILCERGTWPSYSCAACCGCGSCAVGRRDLYVLFDIMHVAGVSVVLEYIYCHCQSLSLSILWFVFVIRVPGTALALPISITATAAPRATYHIVRLPPAPPPPPPPPPPRHTGAGGGSRGTAQGEPEPEPYRRACVNVSACRPLSYCYALMRGCACIACI